jgi:acyl-CoA synthetase (NDP forming)
MGAGYDKDAVRDVLDKALAEGRESLTAPEGRRVCQAYGIPTPGEGLASTADEAVQLAAELGGAVAMKIVSPDILHKTEAGGVKVETSPLLGQHNEDVYVRELGVDPQRLAELKTNGVI